MWQILKQKKADLAHYLFYFEKRYFKIVSIVCFIVDGTAVIFCFLVRLIGVRIIGVLLYPNSDIWLITMAPKILIPRPCVTSSWNNSSFIPSAIHSLSVYTYNTLSMELRFYYLISIILIRARSTDNITILKFCYVLSVPSVGCQHSAVPLVACAVRTSKRVHVAWRLLIGLLITVVLLAVLQSPTVV